MKMRRMIMAALACALLVPAALSAQVRITHRGLLGIFTESVTADGVVRGRVLDVVPGSPAERAGVRKGDIVLSINGQPATDEAMRTGASPGATVVMRVERDGAEHEFSMVVAERPATFQAYVPRMLPDSVLREIAVIMENVRTEVDTVVFRAGRIPMLERSGEVTIAFGGDSVQVLRSFGGDSVRVYRYPTAPVPMMRIDFDSLRTQWSLRADSGRSMWMFQGDTLAPFPFRGIPDDARMRIFQATPGSIDTISAGMMEALASRAITITRDSMGMRPGDIFASGMTVGMRAVAGAELSDLNPGLAEYFGVTGGVLVLNARDGTPAARAGIRPGDVIVQVGQTNVGSIAEVRRAIDSRNGATVQIRVLRRGEPLDFTIGRE